MEEKFDSVRAQENAQQLGKDLYERCREMYGENLLSTETILRVLDQVKEQVLMNRVRNEIAEILLDLGLTTEENLRTLREREDQP